MGIKKGKILAKFYRIKIVEGGGGGGGGGSSLFAKIITIFRV